MQTATVIGSGSHRYEYIDQWGTLPAGIEFGTTHGVVEDSAGRIYIHNTGPTSVIRFAPDGSYIDSWGEEYSKGAHGIHYRREGDGEFLYLAATGLGIVVKTTLDGEELLRITTPPRPDIYDADHRFVPTETTVAPDGTILIADGYGQPWVHRYSPDGRYIDSFGGKGSGPGELDNPHGIMLDTRGSEPRILVSDRGNSRLQYFTLDGKHLSFVDYELRKPCTTIQWRDEIYVPDLYSRLTIFDADDRLVAHLGDRDACWNRPGWPNLPKSEWVVGAFSSPHDLHVDGAGNIYVVEWLSEGTGKVTKLRRVEE
jgi:hypothetical protein